MIGENKPVAHPKMMDMMRQVLKAMEALRRLGDNSKDKGSYSSKAEVEPEGLGSDADNGDYVRGDDCNKICEDDANEYSDDRSYGTYEGDDVEDDDHTKGDCENSSDKQVCEPEGMARATPMEQHISLLHHELVATCSNCQPAFPSNNKLNISFFGRIAKSTPCQRAPTTSQQMYTPRMMRMPTAAGTKTTRINPRVKQVNVMPAMRTATATPTANL